MLNIYRKHKYNRKNTLFIYLAANGLLFSADLGAAFYSQVAKISRCSTTPPPPPRMIVTTHYRIASSWRDRSPKPNAILPKLGAVRRQDSTKTRATLKAGNSPSSSTLKKLFWASEYRALQTLAWDKRWLSLYIPFSTMPNPLLSLLSLLSSSTVQFLWGRLLLTSPTFSSNHQCCRFFNSENRADFK